MTTGFLPSASETLLGFQKETAWATLVSPATFKLLRFTGESLDIRRDNVVSQEIDPGRQVADLAQVGGGAGGGVNFELSYETFEDLLAAALFSDWEPAILSPSPSPAVVHTTLRNGVAPTSFTIQKKINTAVPAYFLYKGMMVDTLSLNIRAKQIVTGSMTFVGKSGALSTTVTGSDTQPNVKAIMNAASGIVVLDTVVSPVPKIIGMTLNIANGLREQPEISTVVADG